MDLYLDSNRLSCEKKLDPTPSASESYCRLAARQNKAGFWRFKILYRLNYLDFKLLCWYQCNVINSVKNAIQSAFIKQSVFYGVFCGT